MATGLKQHLLETHTHTIPPMFTKMPGNMSDIAPEEEGCEQQVAMLHDTEQVHTTTA